MRLKRVLAAVGVVMLGAGVAGCGEDASSSLPEASDAPSAASTAEQEKAVVAVVKRYPKALEQMNKTGDPDVLYPVMAEELADSGTQSYRESVLDKGKTYLGRTEIVSAKPEVSGDSATADVCIDGRSVYEVPEGETRIDPETATMVGARGQTIMTLEFADDEWKITEMKDTGEPC